VAQLIQFFYLQVLDLLTTMAFLAYGISEGNPIIRFVLRLTPDPLGGLLGVKLFAVALGIVCCLMGKQRLLARVNILFAVVVAWNLVALIVGSAAVSHPF
jgi:hypothetical protein